MLVFESRMRERRLCFLGFHLLLALALARRRRGRGERRGGKRGGEAFCGTKPIFGKGFVLCDVRRGRDPGLCKIGHERGKIADGLRLRGDRLGLN